MQKQPNWKWKTVEFRVEMVLFPWVLVFEKIANTSNQINVCLKNRFLIHDFITDLSKSRSSARKRTISLNESLLLPVEIASVNCIKFAFCTTKTSGVAGKLTTLLHSGLKISWKIPWIFNIFCCAPLCFCFFPFSILLQFCLQILPEMRLEAQIKRKCHSRLEKIHGSFRKYYSIEIRFSKNYPLWPDLLPSKFQANRIFA